MLKKLGLGIAVILFSSIAFSADNEFPLDGDPFEHFIGYKDLKQGDGFPPSINEIIDNFGKKSTLEVAQPQIVSFNINDNPNNSMKVKSVSGINFYTIDTNQNQKVVFRSDKYEVRYSVDVGYFYTAEIAFKHNPRFSLKEQEKFLTEKMLGYFKDNGFIEVQKMFGLVKNNVYKKGNITIVMSTETSNRINKWVVTVFNDDVKKEVEEKQNSSLNKNINENFKEIDAFLK